MEAIVEFLEKIDQPAHRERVEQIFSWISNKYPNLKVEMKWNQPMFTDHGTFIIGFSSSRKHLAVAPETVAITHVQDDIAKAGYEHTANLVRIPWTIDVDYGLLEKMIDFNIQDKADCTTFWRT